MTPKQILAALRSAGVDKKTLTAVEAALSKKPTKAPPYIDADEGVTKADPFASFVAEQLGHVDSDAVEKVGNVVPFRTLDGADLFDEYVDLHEFAKNLERIGMSKADIQGVVVAAAKNYADGGIAVRNIEATIEEFELDPTSFPHLPKRTTPQPSQTRAGMSKFRWPRDLAEAMKDRRFDPNYDGDDSLTFGDDSGPEAA